MNEVDKRQFRVLMDELGAAYTHDVSGKYAAYWRVLAPRMSIDMLAGAIDAHMANPDRGRFFPMPADIIAACELARKNPHPGADEAWAICLASFDEASTVCLTDEILSARAVALPVMESGDKIGARMAFRAAYERIVRQAPGAPSWRLSLGYDPDSRAQAAQDALVAGRLSHNAVAHLLPAPAATGPVAEIAGLLAGKVVPHPAAGAEFCRRLREAVGAIPAPARKRGMSREEMERRRSEALGQIETLQEKSA